MKMKPTDFDALRDAIKNAFPRDGRDFAAWKEKYNAAGYSDESFRWDCLHLSGFDTRPLYNYLHDSHIDTALRKIVDCIG